MRAPSPRTYLVASAVALAIAAPLAAAALLARGPASAWVGLLACAHLGLGWSALLVFYAPSYTKRALLPPLPTLLVPAAFAAAVLPLAGASWGAFAALWGLTWLLAAFAGPRAADRTPLHLAEGAYAPADRAAAAAALLAFLLAAAGGALAAVFALGPRAELAKAGAALLLWGPLPLLALAAALHTLPRALKRPLPASWAFGAVAAQGAGALLLAAGLRAGALAVAAAALLVAALAARRFVGAQARAGAPLLLAGAALLALAAALAGAGLPAASHGTAFAAHVAALAGATYVLVPVAVNQVPRARTWTPWIAAAGALGGALLAAGLAWARPVALAGAAVLAGAALAHVVNLAPMRRPRRDC